MLFIGETNAQGRVMAAAQRSKAIGIAVMPASLGDHTGLGGEVNWGPWPLQNRLRVDLNATTTQYNRERVTASWGPLGAVYALEWRPRELYFGPGMTAPAVGASAYAERNQAARLVLSVGWLGFDSTKANSSEPMMFRDRVRLRGAHRRTWLSAWAGPREVSVSRGRDPLRPSFELAHPVEAAGSLNHAIDQFCFGAGLSHDARWGRPHWSSGWRASVAAERFDKSIPALSFRDGHSDARSFTRLSYHLETAVSFGRDPRTLRLALTAVDQQLDATGGTFLLGDLQSLGGSAGLAGFPHGRFRDLDLVVGKLSYLYPLAKNLEFDMHTEAGGVYPHLGEARVESLKHSLGVALRLRTETAMLGALACDWSTEKVRVSLAIGGIE
jgi:hypothetical protein